MSLRLCRGDEGWAVKRLQEERKEDEKLKKNEREEKIFRSVILEKVSESKALENGEKKKFF